MIEVKCEFQTTQKDALGHRVHTDCGKKGAWFLCTGKLASIQMPLCEFHMNHCIREYGWTLKAIEDPVSQ